MDEISKTMSALTKMINTQDKELLDDSALLTNPPSEKEQQNTMENLELSLHNFNESIHELLQKRIYSEGSAPPSTQQRSKFSSRQSRSLLVQAQQEEMSGSQVDNELEQSDQQLENLLEFGSELVTNLKVAQEKQVLQRRAIELREYTTLLDSSTQETKQTLQKFQAVQAKWSELENINEPMELYEELEKQKERIDELLTSKDNIIEQCQAQIQRINECYLRDQDKHAQEICCIIERIDTEIELAKSVYAAHLENVETLVHDEHQQFTRKLKERWNGIFNRMVQNERRMLELLHEKDQFYEHQLKQLATKQEQVTNATRIRLAKDNEMLFLELRNTQVNAMMNSEKLDYNYLVLQKRNAENGLIANQQKRRLNRLNDNIVVLRDKIKTSKAQTSSTLNRLTKSIDKLHANIAELESKSLKIQAQNRQTFDRVWNLNFDEMQLLIRKLYEIDRILHEQQLSIKWTPPSIEIININAVVGKSSTQSAERTLSRRSASSSEASVEQRFLRHVLRRIADCGGMLIEQKLRRILKRYSDNDQMILRLDSILNALQVTNMDELEILAKLFRPYSWCRNCSADMPSHLQQALVKSGSATYELMCTEQNARSCANHVLVSEPALVMRALNEFLKKRLSNNAAKAAASQASQVAYLSNDDIRNFWLNCATIMPPQKLRLWRTVEHAMKHFMEILKEREKLQNECNALRRQNAELKHLLCNF